MMMEREGAKLEEWLEIRGDSGCQLSVESHDRVLDRYHGPGSRKSCTTVDRV